MLRRECTNTNGVAVDVEGEQTETGAWLIELEGEILDDGEKLLEDTPFQNKFNLLVPPHGSV